MSRCPFFSSSPFCWMLGLPYVYFMTFFIHNTSLMDIYTPRCLSRGKTIIKDSSHPGSDLFNLLPSGRRYRCIRTRTNRFKNSFFPKSYNHSKHTHVLISQYRYIVSQNCAFYSTPHLTIVKSQISTILKA